VVGPKRSFSGVASSSCCSTSTCTSEVAESALYGADVVADVVTVEAEAEADVIEEEEEEEEEELDEFASMLLPPLILVCRRSSCTPHR
jgi:hypothetical protein